MQHTAYTLAVLIAAAVPLCYAVYAWRRETFVATAPFAVLMLALATWSFGYAFELAATDESVMRRWAKLEYAGIVIVPTAWLALALELSRRGRWLRRSTLALASVEPVLILALVVTNEAHGLIWSDLTVGTAGGVSFLDPAYGAGFWLHLTYSYLLLLMGAAILFPVLFRSHRLPRSGAFVAFAGLACPWVVNAARVAGLAPTHMDLTPFAFVVTAVAVGWVLFRNGWLDLMPVTHGAILDRVEDAVIVLDELDRIAYVNSTAVELLARPRVDLLGRRLDESPSPLTEALRPHLGVDRAKTEVGTGSGEGRRVHELTVSSLPGARDAACGRLLVLRDVTAFREAESALPVAPDGAVAATRLESELLPTLSHEIRTQLNGIIGMAGVLAETELDREQRECTETVRSSAEALLAIIDAGMDLSEIETGKLELEETEFDLRELTEEVTDRFGGRAQSKGLELSSWVSERVATAFYGDSGRIRQILSNFLSNAIKLTERGSILVEVDQKTCESGDARVTFAVTGTGLSAAARQTLFEPHSQGDGPCAREHGGMDLGLAISKRLVELMHGKIGVEERQGGGSRLWFTIPLARPQRTASSTRVSRTALRGRYALLLDEHPTDRRALLSQLKLSGTQTETADNGRQALALLRVAVTRGRGYDLVLADVDAVGENATILRTLRAESSLRHVAVALLAQPGEREQAEKLVRDGLAAAVLIKPVREARLYEGLVECLAEAERRVQGAPAATPAPAAGESPGEHTRARGRRVLIAASSPPKRAHLTGIVRGLGLNPTVVSNGVGVTAEARREIYDLILLDGELSDMSAATAAALIRRGADPRRCATIVGLIDSAGAGPAAGAATAGMDEVVERSADEDVLGAVIQRRLTTPKPERTPGAAPAAPRLVVAAPEAPPKSTPREGRILVTEDNPVNQRVAVRMLERLGWKADVAASGREALAATSATAYDLVLMDCQMPEMDGLEATRAIRQREGSERRLIIVAMTANAMKGDRERCIEAGMDDYLAKPVRMEDLRRVLGQWLEPEGEAEPAAAAG